MVRPPPIVTSKPPPQNENRGYGPVYGFEFSLHSSDILRKHFDVIENACTL